MDLYKPWEESNGKQILVVNCGSSSIKVSLFEYDQEGCRRMLDGNLKELNTPETILEITSSKGKESYTSSEPLTVDNALTFLLTTIARQFNFSFASLLGIGHRFVHGGNKYRSSILINPKVISELEKLTDLDPLHNPICLSGIQQCQKLGKAISQVAVFDTSFFQKLPNIASSYAIPKDIASKYQIKRYGFHGISHAFLWKTFEKYRGENGVNSKIISLHLGNGCSITATSGGIPIDTSMGFTPSEGLVMGTRAGDIDASVVEFLCRHGKKSPGEVMEILNVHSGLLGLSSISSDIKTLMGLYQTNEQAKFAIDLFCYRIVKYLGAYIAALEGVEAIIFSGGIGENAVAIREQIISKMGWYGFKLDGEANEKAVQQPPGAMHKISAPDSSASIFVIASDENIFIANEVLRLA